MVEVAYHRMAASPGVVSFFFLHGCRRLSCAKRKSNHAPDATIQWRIMHVLQALYNVRCEFKRGLELMPATPSVTLRVRAARAQQTLTFFRNSPRFRKVLRVWADHHKRATLQILTASPSPENESEAGSLLRPRVHHRAVLVTTGRRPDWGGESITGSRRKRQNYESEPLKERLIQPPPDRGENTANWSHGEAANCASDPIASGHGRGLSNSRGERLDWASTAGP